MLHERVKENDVKKIAGWLILMVVIGGIFVATGISEGWLMAVVAWGAGIGIAGLLIVAAKWISD